jgi:hypothetical protein
VAPAAWAQPALPAAAAASRPGHWPGTYALAAIAATLPQTRAPSPGADDASDGSAPGANGHLNGHHPTAEPRLDAYGAYDSDPGATGTPDQHATGGHQP